MSKFAARIRLHVRRELDAAAQAERAGDAVMALCHLGRAHVLGQGATREHVRVHLAMARWALRRVDLSAAWGQAWRGVSACVLTPLGLLPHGNTGYSNVSAFRRMPIPRDLQALIDAARR